MPGMNGRQLAEQLRPSQPGMRVLFVSGYSDQFLSRGGSIDSRAEYLQKPFTRAQLVDALRRVMESR
jgi:FixJ family two-component response regulator